MLRCDHSLSSAENCHNRSKSLQTFTNTNKRFAQNIDYGYLLEPPRRGGSNEYPQSMFLSRKKKINVYPCKPQVYYIKVGVNAICVFSWCFIEAQRRKCLVHIFNKTSTYLRGLHTTSGSFHSVSLICISLDKEKIPGIYFGYFSTKTYLVGTH